MQPPALGRAARGAGPARGGGGERGSVAAAGAPGQPEGALLSAERRGELLEALERLRDDDRLVIGCRYLLDLSERETAQALGCRPGTVKSRLSRALERLPAELTPPGETGGAAPRSGVVR